MNAEHEALRRQIDGCTRSGQVDLNALIVRVSAAYSEFDQERRRDARANRLMAEELTQSMQAQAALLDEIRHQSQRFEAALNNMCQGLCMFDAQQRMVVCNPQFRQLWRWEEGEWAAGATYALFVERARSLASDAARVGAALEHLSDGLDTSVLFQVDLSDGRTISGTHKALPDGGFVQTFQDVTARRLADERIVHLATHDVLTDLPNRLLLQRRMEAALCKLGEGLEVAVLCIDLDRFKPVNDSLGHPVGDSLLSAVANRLRAQLRSGDTVARLGGDEFAVLLTGHDVNARIERIAQRMVADLSLPYDIDGQRVVIGASIGIAVAPEDGDTPLQLLKNADMALYAAKSDGRGCSRRFEVEMGIMARGRRTLENDLRQAIARSELTLHYQPLVNLRERRIEGFEALMRWSSVERGAVSPAVFIPIAEELNLINDLGAWALRQACADAVSWDQPFKISVNVSAKQLQSPGFFDVVVDALQCSGLPARRLELEITESVLMHKHADTIATLHRLRERGVSIAMDDFGTGYSSLAYLSSFPFDKIKIDRSFVHAIGKRPDAEAIIRSVAGLCKSLGIASTAEGVETDEQLSLLAQEACTQVQGFLFSKPVPCDQVQALVQDLTAKMDEGAAMALAD